MKTTIFRNPEKLELNKVIDLFKDSLEKTEVFSDSEIEVLAETYAKNPVDKFIVAEELSGTDDACQGDIIVLAEKTNMYKENYPRVKGWKETDRLVPQEGDSLTGDHRIIPAEGSKYVIKTCKFVPKFLEGKNRWGREPEYTAVSFETDKPFLIFHREHGNMAYTAGKYMFYSQLDPDTLDRMMD
jgi:hypothetical protein